MAKCSGISIYETRRKFGFQNYKIQVTVNGRTHILDTYEVSESDRGWNLLSSPELGMEFNLRLMPLDRSHQYALKVSLKNTLERDLRLEAVAFGQFGCDARFLPGESHVLAWGLRYAHTGNLRTERYPLCAADYPYARHLPVETRVLGDTEDQPFPALFIDNDLTKWGLVAGMARQRAAAPVFVLRRQPLYLQLTEGRESDQAFEDYLDLLQSGNSFLSATTSLNDKALHCTWNYGVLSDQREEPLLKTARFIAKEMAKVKFFLVDDGYLNHEPNSRVYLNRFYPDPEQDVTEKSWPRAISVDRRKLGHPEQVEAVDFWNDTRTRWKKNFVTQELDPRSARLFEVRW